eukprot:9489920-Pyramimonas_sp.AAC.2
MLQAEAQELRVPGGGLDLVHWQPSGAKGGHELSHDPVDRARVSAEGQDVVDVGADPNRHGISDHRARLAVQGGHGPLMAARS